MLSHVSLALLSLHQNHLRHVLPSLCYSSLAPLKLHHPKLHIPCPAELAPRHPALSTPPAPLDNMQDRALHAASSRGELHQVQALLKQGARPHWADTVC